MKVVHVILHVMPFLDIESKRLWNQYVRLSQHMVTVEPQEESNSVFFSTSTFCEFSPCQREYCLEDLRTSFTILPSWETLRQHHTYIPKAETHFIFSFHASWKFSISGFPTPTKWKHFLLQRLYITRLGQGVGTFHPISLPDRKSQCLVLPRSMTNSSWLQLGPIFGPMSSFYFQGWATCWRSVQHLLFGETNRNGPRSGHLNLPLNQKMEK